MSLGHAGLTPLSMVPRRATWLESRARAMVADRLERLAEGRLTIAEPAGARVFGPGRTGEPAATLVPHDPRFWAEVAFGGSLGAAESYVRGDWDTDDLTALIRLLARQRGVLANVDGGMARLRAPLATAFHRLHRNTRHGAQRNITAHYDLGNDFFALFLDPSLMYSCALFPRPEATLEEASRHKLDVICRALELQPGIDLVEIGTGWGGLGIHAAREYGARVITTTISREQHREAVARVHAAGLSDRVTVLQADYRDLPRGLAGRRFDRLVSIEMIEAVGAEYLGDYFEVLGRLLSPEGRGLVQAIVIRDQDEAAYRSTVDFIQRYIFPGGCLPSVRGMVEAVARRSQLRVAGLEDWTPHYALTLSHWRARFHAQSGALDRMGFDATFRRLWHWYFCYCEAAFLERTCGLVHLHLAGPRAGTGAP